MIDLGDELANYDDEPPKPKQTTYSSGDIKYTSVDGGGMTTPLAGLQAAGFNTAPPAGHFDNPDWRQIVAGRPSWTVVTDNPDDPTGTSTYTISGGGGGGSSAPWGTTTVIRAIEIGDGNDE